ncbi:hypothetical protein M2323_001956 [Rhodoblastus acidophilus]|nr:hypothetical protein [Rhodoblastus acidophilus]MCW2333034.1 hypothetical protein [Rhodoblastus acidophilus]
MVKILAAVLDDGLAVVESACAEALADNVHSADVVLNILARRRDPPPPLTIATPDALKLQCAPAAEHRRARPGCATPASSARARYLEQMYRLKGALLDAKPGSRFRAD